MSKKEELRQAYYRERGNFRKAVSKARKKGYDIDVQYPAIPKQITESSIRAIINAHNKWHFETFGKAKKQSVKQQSYGVKIPKYQQVERKKGDINKRSKTSNKKQPKVTKPLAPIEPIEPEPPIDYISPIETPSNIDDIEPIEPIESYDRWYDELETLEDATEGRFKYSISEDVWVDTTTGQIVSQELVMAFADNDVADIENYTEDFIENQLMNLSVSHEKSSNFLREQLNRLSLKDKQDMLGRLSRMSEKELEKMAVELYYSSHDGGTKAASALARLLGVENDMVSMKAFQEALYEESVDESPLKKQARENRIERMREKEKKRKERRSNE